MIILASKSPRRVELLKKIIPTFNIIPANIDESLYPISQVSYQKGIKIALDFPNDTIISADTSVQFNDKIYGKPKDKLDAISMLNELSNNTHKVITYYSIININKNIQINKKIISYVTFNKLTKEEIINYVNSNSPLDKAGAYGIQDNEKYHIIKEFIGSKNNIIGLPIEEINNDLISLGLKIY